MMKKSPFKLLGLLAALSLPAIGTATAQDGRESYVPQNKPNQYTKDCIAAPTQKCALEAALQTVLNEQLGGERARVLIGVAEALIDLGQIDRAIRTLKVALNEARGAGLTLIYEEKIKDIAPLFMRAGDSASALALVDQTRYGANRDSLLSRLAKEAARRGDLAAMRVALGQIRNQNRAFWEQLNWMIEAPTGSLGVIDYPSLEQKILGYERSDSVHRGFTLLAGLAFKQGDEDVFQFYLDRAVNRFSALISEPIRLEQIARRIDILFRAGVPVDKIEPFYDDFAGMETKRIRGASFKTYSRLIIGYEAHTGRVEKALARLQVYEGIEIQMAQLPAVVAPASADYEAQLQDYYADSLTTLLPLESAFERDRARLSILRGAVQNNLTGAALSVISTLEDDDSQAVGLALSARLLAD